MKLMDPVATVEVVEVLNGEAEEGRQGYKSFDKSVKSRKLQSLTQKTSAWHDYSLGDGEQGGGRRGGGNEAASGKKAEVTAAASPQVEEFEAKIKVLSDALNNPNNMLDIDDTLEEIARLKAEIRRQKGWFSW